MSEDEIWILLFVDFWLIDFLFEDDFFLIMKVYLEANSGTFLVLQWSLMSNSIVSRCGNDFFNVLKFFSYKDSWADFFYYTTLLTSIIFYSIVGSGWNLIRHLIRSCFISC